jgi:hypothetical protein
VSVFAAVKAADILEVIWVSLVAGVVVSTTYSCVVLGTARSADARRNGQGSAAVLWGGVALIAFAAFAATVVYGVHIMLSKS